MRASFTLQLKAQTLSKKTQVKIEWYLHSNCSYIFWGGDTENKFKE